MYLDNLFEKMFPQHIEAVKNSTTPLPTDFDCYRSLIETFEDSCERLDDYGLKYMKAFVAQCEGMKSYPEQIEVTKTMIKDTCAEQTL